MAASSDTALETTPSVESIVESAGDQMLVGAASRSVLPTVDGTTNYLGESAGYYQVDPFDPVVFVAAFDQGQVDVGNGDSDAAWVHDDLRATAVAFQSGESMVVMVGVDLYMVFAADAAEIEARARTLLPAHWRDAADIIISATHNHEGPDSAFSINDDWYDHAADEIAAAIGEAVSYLEPATLHVASDEHRFGVSDGRDPIVIDPSLRVMTAVGDETGDALATIVQWASHPETTLGFAQEFGHDITADCAAKGWAMDDCTAEGRYFTSDYPGVMRDVVRSEIGGEVLYLNGAIGSQIGPGEAPVWVVDDSHPVGNGWTVPDGAVPVAGAADFTDENFATAEAIGTQLGLHVLQLASSVTPVASTGSSGQIEWREQSFFTRLTNIGFRVLLADGDLGWQLPMAYSCPRPFDEETCVSDDGAFVDDPVLTPLVGSQIRVGDVLRTRIVHVRIGDVGFMFLPGELPPELVIGLPADWATDSDQYYVAADEQHARGDDYRTPGYLLDLVDEPTTFVVGLGGDELGYWVPLNEVKMRCAADILGPEGGCAAAFEAGLIDFVDGVSGTQCRTIEDVPALLGAADPALAQIALDSCRYGQALGRELGEPPGHYEETNSAGWDLVDDTWAAAVQLFGRDGSGSINPNNPGYTLYNPPPSR